MEVTFWGVRGSVPAPGPTTMRYGGNTACVSARLSNGSLFIFDCGTGARQLGNELMKGPLGQGKGEANVLLSMSQWDHIQGFPFFRPFYLPGNKFRLFGNSSNPGQLEQVLEFQMAAQYFPVQTIKNMAANLSLEALTPGEVADVGGAKLSGVRTDPGPMGAMVFRVQEGDRVLAYAGHAGYDEKGASKEALDLYRNADLLIHECSFTPEDGQRYRNRGLASLQQALDAAIGAGVKKLALFHYDQDYTDHEIDTLLDRAREEAKARKSQLEIIAATEGETIEV